MENQLIYFVFTLTVCFNTSCFDEQKIIIDCQKDEIASNKLISPEEIIDQQAFINFLFIEVSDSVEYSSGHLAGALNIWRPKFRTKLKSNYSGLRCTEAELVQLLRELGVEENTQLVIYDAKGASDAFRLSWIFDLYGFSNYKVLNGGKKLWIKMGLPLETLPSEKPSFSNYNFKPKFDKALLANLEDLKNALIDSNTILIDTREPYEFYGQPFIKEGKIHMYKKGAFDSGCIPGAIHINWSEMSDLDGDHRIKCKKDLIYNFTSRGVTKDKKVIVYCQSGSRSSHTAFVLREILGFPHVKNYDGSWIEWTYHHEKYGSVPIERHTDEIQINKLRKFLAKELNLQHE